MSDADDAYEAAKKEIARVSEAGEASLNFDRAEFRALTRIPTEIDALDQVTRVDLQDTQISDLSPLKALSGLQELYLTGTQVVDIVPLNALTELRVLRLSRTKVLDLASISSLRNLEFLAVESTKVSDLSPVQGFSRLKILYAGDTRISNIGPLNSLRKLEALHLSDTTVSDISPLTSLTSLHTIYLDDTNVFDLRPLLKLPNLGISSRYGIFFHRTPAALSTPNMTRLSELTDDSERTRETLAYLKTLPPWPKPLPWELEEAPTIPPSQPAPLQVAEVDGVLRPALLGDQLDAEGNLLAKQGWDALRDYLADLADQKPRIANAMPRLVSALNRLESALGTEFDAMNAVSVGTQGNRVIRLSRHAAEMLMDEDSDDIAEFAAALALFLERFDEWRAYRDAAVQTPPDPAKIADALPKLAELATLLAEHAEIDPTIPESLNAQNEDAREEPDDAVVAAGLLASSGNVLSALATRAMPVLKFVKREAGDITGQSWKKAKGTIATGIGAGLTGTAADILVTGGTNLKWLAQTFPDKLGWLLKFLNAFGLG